MIAQKLLIIDDSPDIQELVTIWLGEEALQFLSCLTGHDGIRDAAVILPDLILLDVDLPDINGFEVCRQLKADPATSSIPIVFLTGASSTEEKLCGLALGAIDYVTKPFDPAELQARVRAALNTKRLMDLLAQKAATLQESEERFRILAENSSDVISRNAPDGVFLYASPACAGILGYTPAEIVGRSLLNFVHPEEASAIATGWAAQSTAGETKTLSFRFLRSDGHYVWLEATCRTVIDPISGAIREIQAASRDITIRKQMEFREQIRVDVLEMVAEGNPLNDILHLLVAAAEQQEQVAFAAGIMLCGNQMLHCAPRMPASMSAAIELQMHQLVCRCAEIAAQGTERIIVCDLQADPAWATLWPAMSELGILSCWSIPILSRRKEASGLFTLYRRDHQRPNSSAVELLKLASELASVAIEHRQLTDQLTFQALHDTLTQLPNRAMFTDRLEHSLASSQRSNKSGAVILVDVDHFKHVNDTYGHQAGDEMLCQVAQRLGKRLRKSDSLARMGGDEFAMILGELTRPDDAHAVASALIHEFAAPIDLRGRQLFISVSMGLALYPQDGTDPTTLLRNADLALYKAKDAGRNTQRAFTAGMREGATERLELEGSLRQALANDEFRLFYQPKVDPAGRIVGLEALLRWHHPTLGLVPPGRFIPLAEETGLIVAIGVWVLREVVRQAREWIGKGIFAVPIAVNVSALQFAQPDFISTISKVIAEAGLANKWLELELTESLLMRNMSDAAEKLAKLKDLGVDVAIDDFGTGYSSLAYLQRLAIDTLKIDQSFISTIQPDISALHADVRTVQSERQSSNSRTIVRAIVLMAKSLGLRIVAEGVETPVQQQFLSELGCDLMQGYLFGRPKPADLTELMLQNQTALLPESMAMPA